MINIYREGKIKRQITMFWTKQDIPEANERYRSLITEISNLTQDELLHDKIGNLDVYEYYPKCIRGYGTRVYATNKSYIQILEDFAIGLNAPEWEYFETPGNPHKVSYRSKNMDIIISNLALGGSNGDYETVYSIEFMYAEPAVASCFG